MRVLLDTNTFLWYIRGNERLSQVALETIENPNNDVLISTVSLWEMAIKINIGKLKFDFSWSELLKKIAENDFTLLEVFPTHIEPLLNLPLHHRDPFDRLLVAQAMIEGMPILSSDEILGLYPVQWIPAQ